MTCDYDQNCQDTLVTQTRFAINPYNLSGHADFSTPINELLHKLYTYTISKSYNVSMAATDYFVKSLALWKIARQYQYHAMPMPLEPLQVLLQAQERT